VACVLKAAIVPALLALVLAGGAQAMGGRYVFDGGSARQRAQVHAALEASEFDWSLVPAEVTIHLAPGTGTYATRGEIWIDTDLLTAGPFAWGPIQHEYAHQVDFFLLDGPTRAYLNRELGGRVWTTPASTVLRYGQTAEHAQLGAERFASTLAWAYWQSPANSMRPRCAGDESSGMDPAAFRATLSRLIGAA
jgi:hypothetical protein